jgi:hypothetical protein
MVGAIPNRDSSGVVKVWERFSSAIFTGPEESRLKEGVAKVHM